MNPLRRKTSCITTRDMDDATRYTENQADNIIHNVTRMAGRSERRRAMLDDIRRALVNGSDKRTVDRLVEALQDDYEMAMDI